MCYSMLLYIMLNYTSVSDGISMKAAGPSLYLSADPSRCSFGLPASRIDFDYAFGGRLLSISSNITPPTRSVSR